MTYLKLNPPVNSETGIGPEFGFLADICLDNSVRLDPHEGRGKCFDWKRFLNLAARHGVESQVGLRVAESGFQAIPNSVRQTLDSRVLVLAEQSMRTRYELAWIVEAISGAGFRCLLLKGSAIGDRIYACSNARDCIDIDVLVSENDILPIDRLLLDRGYERLHPAFPLTDRNIGTISGMEKHCVYQFPGSSVTLEIHWRLFGNRRLFPIGFDRLLAESDELRIAGRPIRVLNLEVLALYLSCHGSFHAWSKLKWIGDLHRLQAILAGRKWQRVQSRAREMGIDRMVGLGQSMVTYLRESPKGVCRRRQLDKCTQYARNRLMSDFQSRSVTFGELGRIGKEAAYHMRLRRDVGYKIGVLTNLITDVRNGDVIRFGGMPMQVAAGPLLAARRILAREMAGLPGGRR